MFGRTEQRTFRGSTTLTKTSVQTLQSRWFVGAGDAVTATPIVANGTVYAGSWDGKLRAIALATGRYALRADTGRMFWEHDYTGRPGRRPNPRRDPTRIFTSPAVVGNHVLFGTTNDGQQGYRGYFGSANLLTGKPQWEFQTDVTRTGRIANNGCNGVWGSPTVDRGHGLVFFDTADCDATNDMPYAEAIIGLHYATGRPAWVFRPHRRDTGCDWDFGATPNFRPAARGRPAFLGVGGKDGTYYSISPSTGKLRWWRNVVPGGTSGGFIGTAAIDGRHVYGATAIGELPGAPCDPSNPKDQQVQEPSMHAFDARTGKILWQGAGSQSVSATTVAGGMTFVCTAFSQQLQVRDASTGTPLFAIPIRAGCNSGVVVAGNMVLVGEGEAENPTASGIELFTPGAAPPRS
jgi:outer membrane protein assembly factor BamB